MIYFPAIVKHHKLKKSVSNNNNNNNNYYYYIYQVKEKHVQYETVRKEYNYKCKTKYINIQINSCIYIYTTPQVPLRNKLLNK